MRYSMTFTEEQFDALIAHLFTEFSTVERAAYLLCGLGQTANETRLLVRQVIPIADSVLLAQTETAFTIPSRSFLPVLKIADQQSACFVLVHSHPPEIPNHSLQDDREERKLFATAYNRVAGPSKVHASLVLSAPTLPRGRVWLDGGATSPIDVIRVIGRRFRFFLRTPPTAIDISPYDRQVRAFGSDLMPLLKTLTVGIVGAGGTGSSVTEQLIRLGVKRLIIADGQKLERSNVSRVYGSSVNDVGLSKAMVLARLADRIGLGTEVEVIDKPVTYRSVLERFRDCDVIFGCSDDEWGRSLLCRFALQYSVPVFDLGVKLDSDGGVVRSIVGRVTLLMPGTRCLFCRGHISPEVVSAEIAEQLSPGEAARLREQGYIRELPGTEPSVVAFTTATAAFAIAEFLDRIAGYKPEDQNFGEIVVRFDGTVIRKPGHISSDSCFCTDHSIVGRGDQDRFLDQTWRPE